MKTDQGVMKADDHDVLHGGGISGHWPHQVFCRKKVPVLCETGLRNRIHATGFTPAGAQHSSMHLIHLALVLMWC